jgi:hypothetical protein
LIQYYFISLCLNFFFQISFSICFKSNKTLNMIFSQIIQIKNIDSIVINYNCRYFFFVYTHFFSIYLRKGVFKKFVFFILSTFYFRAYYAYWRRLFFYDYWQWKNEVHILKDNLMNTNFHELLFEWAILFKGYVFYFSFHFALLV